MLKKVRERNIVEVANINMMTAGNLDYPTFCSLSIQFHTPIFIIKKESFYCINTSYSMDDSLSGRRGPARQTSEKDVLCLHRPGRPSTVHSPDGVSYFLPV